MSTPPDVQVSGGGRNNDYFAKSWSKTGEVMRFGQGMASESPCVSPNPSLVRMESILLVALVFVLTKDGGNLLDQHMLLLRHISGNKQQKDKVFLCIKTMLKLSLIEQIGQRSRNHCYASSSRRTQKHRILASVIIHQAHANTQSISRSPPSTESISRRVTFTEPCLLFLILWSCEKTPCPMNRAL